MKKILHLLGPAPIRTGYADSADFMRVICAFLISWFHIWQQSWLNPNFSLFGRPVNIYPVVTCGYMFVDLMLLLSGFLLMLSYLTRERFDLRSFYTSRAARILPSYYACLILFFFISMLPQISSIPASNLWIDILSHLTFTHNLFPESYLATNFNGVLWTLAVEVQFYLIFPFIAKQFRQKPVTVYCIMAAFAFFYRWYIGRYFSDISLYFNRLPAMMDVYANGMLAACIFHRLGNSEPKMWRAWLSTLLTLICFVGFYHILYRQRMFSDYSQIRAGQMHYRFMLSCTGAVFLVCGSRSIALFRHLFSNRIVRFLSSLSFSYYMLHQFLAVKLKAWHIPGYGEGYTGNAPNVDGQHAWQTSYTLFCFLGALLLAALMTYLIEKPCAKQIKKRFSSPKKLETEDGKC